MEKLISEGKKLITYPILGYWLDIGKLDDYKKAQEDIKHIDSYKPILNIFFMDNLKFILGNRF